MKHVQRPHRGKPCAFLDALMHVTKLQETHVRTIIAMGGAYLGKLRCKDPARLVKSGEMIGAYYRFPPRMHPVAFDAAWILAEANGLMITNKPRGYPTQGRRDADYMAFYELLKQNVTGYVGLHHRLDQDTSGLLVFTRDQAHNKALAAAFLEKRIQKTYLAVLTGPWMFDGDEVVIDAPITTQQTANGTRHCVAKDGKVAQSVFRKLAQAEGLVLAAVAPITGRTHQIRVHAHHVGMPLWGDWLYAEAGEPPYMLHCERLAWSGVAGLADAEWHAPIPPDWHTRLPQALQDALPSKD